MRRALVVSPETAVVQALGHVLGPLGFSQTVAAELSGMEPHPADELELVVLDLDGDPGVDGALLAGAAAQRCPGATLITLAGPDARRRLVESLAHPAVRHIVAKPRLAASGAEPGPPYGPPDARSLFAALHLDRQAARAPMPGVRPFLGAAAVVEERWVADPTSKDSACEAVTRFGQRAALRDEMLRRLDILSDELIENALYDAACDEHGRHRYARMDLSGRSLPAILAPGEQIRVQVGSDGGRLALAVADPFGTLQRAKLIEHLGKLLDAGGVRTQAGYDGAGIGLVMVYLAANQINIRVIPQQATEVTAVIDLSPTNRASLERGTSLHYSIRPLRPAEATAEEPRP